MSSGQQGNGHKENQGHPPQRKPAIIRVLRALKRHYHRHRARNKKAPTEHQINERMMARWTRHVGIFTVVLAIIAAVTAGIFWRQLGVMQGQLDEMKSGSEQTERAIAASNRIAATTTRQAENAEATAIRQLRAYIAVDNLTVHCTACETFDPSKPIEPKQGFDPENWESIDLENGGQTPAYAVRGILCFHPVAFGQGLPNDFNYPDCPGSTGAMEGGSVTLNRDGKTPMVGGLGASDIAMIVAAQKHKTTLYAYGHIDYEDIFHIARNTPFCAQYVPDFGGTDLGRSQNGAACPKHNTPDKDK